VFVGAYGKLPAFGDFVGVRATTELALGFQQWLGSALDWAEQRQLPGWPAEFDGLPPAAFTFRPRLPCPGVLAGVLRASRDAVGRRFPFAVFAGVPDDVARSSAHLLPLAMSAFVDRATTALPALERATSVAELEEALSGLHPIGIDDHVEAAYEAWTRATRAADLWRSLYRAEDGAGARYAVQMIHGALAPFAQAPEARTDLAVRLPLGGEPARATAFWIDLAQRLGGVPRATPTALFYPAPTTPSRALLLLLGESHPSALAEATVGAGESELVCDLTAPAPDPESVRRLPVLGSALCGEISSAEATLRDVLDAAGAISG
jgi:type VI secretion system protein ImpM